MQFYFILIFLLFPFVIYATDIYIAYDEEGQPIFSDISTPGSKLFNLDEDFLENISLNSHTLKKLDNQNTYSKPGKKFISPSIDILLPENDSTIIATTGEVEIVLNVNPPLDQKQKINILDIVDNKEHVVLVTKQIQDSIKNLERGEHRLVAKVVDSNGKVISESSPIIVHIKKPMIPIHKRKKINQTGP